MVAESIYRMSIIPPPAYSEAPADDLAAELAQMKVMMEQMRFEKEQMEMEAKRKAEEEAAAAQLRAEQEEARELAEIHKRFHEGNIKSRWHYLDDRNKALLSSLSQRETVLLYEHYGPHLTYIVTNKNIYRVWKQDILIPNVGSLYTFDTVLTKKQTILLESAISTYPDGGYGRLLGRVSVCHYNVNDPHFHCTYVHTSAPTKFETIIRLIPGSYKNGDWRQLDGFFGMYFNETTMEVSEVPPPSI